MQNMNPPPVAGKKGFGAPSRSRVRSQEITGRRTRVHTLMVNPSGGWRILLNCAARTLGPLILKTPNILTCRDVSPSCVDSLKKGGAEAA